MSAMMLTITPPPLSNMNTTIENLENRNHWAAKADAAPLGSPERAELDGIVAEFDSLIAFDAEALVDGEFSRSIS